MAFTGTTRKGRKKIKQKKTVVFRAVSFQLGCSPGLSFGTTNNRDTISHNPAPLELVLLALIAVGGLLGSLEGLSHTLAWSDSQAVRVKKIQ